MLGQEDAQAGGQNQRRRVIEIHIAVEDNNDNLLQSPRWAAV